MKVKIILLFGLLENNTRIVESRGFLKASIIRQTTKITIVEEELQVSSCSTTLVQLPLRCPTSRLCEHICEFTRRVLVLVPDLE